MIQETATDPSQLEDAAVVGDLGGGTIVSVQTQDHIWDYLCSNPQDGASYLISSLDPLSLSGLAFVTGQVAVIIPQLPLTQTGCVIGSSDLNDGFRKAMKTRLEPVAHQLRRDSGQSLDQILDELVDWFEFTKRSFSGPRHRTMYARVSHLKEDPERGFQAAQIEIPRSDANMILFHA